MKKEEIYQDLKRQILILKLVPGELLDEVSLSQKYLISRTPMREIFQMLAGEGYLEIIKNKGAKVSSMNHKTLRTFFLTAPMMYAIIGRLAVENGTEEQINRLQEIQNLFQDSERNNDTTEMAFQNNSFHQLLGEMSNNPYLMPSYKKLLIDHTRIGQTFFEAISQEMLTDLKQASNDHQEMIQCIIDRNPEKMVQITINHWQLSKNRMELYVSPDPLPIDSLNIT